MTDETGDNRRATLQLYTTFLTQWAGTTIAIGVVFFAEVQAIPYWGWFAYLLMVLTILVTFYGLEMLFYWNRRIQIVMNTPLPNLERRDSLISLDDHYALAQYDREKFHRLYCFTNWKMNPTKVNTQTNPPSS